MPKPYELTNVDKKLLAKCRKGIEYEDNGDPIKDVMDEDEMVDAIRLLLDVVSRTGSTET